MGIEYLDGGTEHLNTMEACSAEISVPHEPYEQERGVALKWSASRSKKY
jgi:hypothetical protein